MDEAAGGMSSTGPHTGGHGFGLLSSCKGHLRNIRGWFAAAGCQIKAESKLGEGAASVSVCLKVSPPDYIGCWASSSCSSCCCRLRSSLARLKTSNLRQRHNHKTDVVPKSPACRRFCRWRLLQQYRHTQRTWPLPILSLLSQCVLSVEISTAASVISLVAHPEVGMALGNSPWILRTATNYPRHPGPEKRCAVAAWRCTNGRSARVTTGFIPSCSEDKCTIIRSIFT